MTTTEPTPAALTPQEWSDQRIKDAVFDNARFDKSLYEAAIAVAFEIRDSYEATIATQAARIAALEQELADRFGEEAATADEPGYIGSTTWKGWTVDLYQGDDNDE